MFDAKSLLEAMMQGATQGTPAHPSQMPGGPLGNILGQMMGGAQVGGQAAAGGGGLGDILGQLAKAASQGGQASPAAAGGLGGLGGLGDILGKMMQPGAGQATAGAAQASGMPGGLGGLGDILGKLGGAGGGQAGGGSIMDVLGSILGQATQGVQSGARDIDGATGASKRMGDVLAQATGMSPEDAMAKLKEMMAQHQMGAGAAMGGLGAAVLGTRTGRSVAVQAAKLGALALIGGLAYHAYQNYSQGKPVSAPAPVTPMGGAAAMAAPAGSGFEAAALTHDSAELYLRAMIASAAAGGRMEADQQQNILGALGQSGVDDAQHTFLRQQLANPASPDELAAACQGPEQAVQVYTAARMAAHLDNAAEAQFMAELAAKLGVDETLAAHIEAQLAKAV